MMIKSENKKKFGKIHEISLKNPKTLMLGK